jgi:UDP-glucose 4-epimerase
MTYPNNVSVAVTGGAGLIGSYLVEILLQAGNRVVVIDDFSKGSRENINAVKSFVEVREGDLESRVFANEALSGFDIVYHLASRAYGVGYSQNRHLEMLSHNERVTTNVIDALEISRPKHVLMTSSSCIYDDSGPDLIPELPLFDGYPESVNRGYGWAKRFLEQKSNLFSQETKVPVTIVRPFNIYGERYQWLGESSQAIPMLVKRVLDGESPITVWGSGEQRRSYIHALDCSRMMKGLVDIGYVTSPINLGTKETISIKGLVELICRLANIDPCLYFDLSKPEGRKVKSSDARLFETVMENFKFSISLERGISRMLGWYKKTFQDGKEF